MVNSCAVAYGILADSHCGRRRQGAPIHMSATIHQLGTSPRVLLVIDQPLLAQYVALALNHGISLTQVARNTEETLAALATWRPHLAVIDMDLAHGAILERLGYTAPTTDRIPVIALTRRGDLQTKLAAFDHGVDDILTVPFSPEELVARVLVVMRRTYHEKVEFTPVLQLGDLEIDILNRLVRAHGKELHLTSIEQSLLYRRVGLSGEQVPLAGQTAVRSSPHR